MLRFFANSTIRSVCLAIGSAVAIIVPGLAQAAVEIKWWHAMRGELGRQIDQIATDFNASQAEFRIIPVYKGTYTETMTAALFALRTGSQPAIVQVNEVATATMMAAKGAVYPVFELMRDQGEPFHPAAYLPVITGYYNDPAGNLLSFPFNASTPILYYNKDQFRVAGLDPDKPPRTWPEVGAAAAKLRGAGIPCGFTTHWPSWVHIENLAALHNIPFATKANGFAGLDVELAINHPLIERHVAALAEWQRTNAFVYGGRGDRAETKFLASECGIFVGSSAQRADFIANANFEIGYGMLPYWPDVTGAPRNSLIGGATLWVLKGRPAQEYIGVGRFFGFLSRAEVQARWHQTTGYLAVTRAAYELTRAQGFYAKNPGTNVATQQITFNAPSENSKGIRLGSFVLVREVIEDELEQALAGKKTAKSALDAALTRGNDILRKFEKASR